ncbi:uncharacterized protein TA11315 [Theileria annulata]|uniref:Uncharacterized protein n=1 Tax=Theileria annulata TaxID=5874 RepID=Q4U8L3_THEAN|nr:uncharacterized protein TA11315 [Theileria annulata]CAI76840.1 hypothetical protein TA11315 [Theileria annulata]|eukprot:XP_953465.1 hypothetical protein TA11315 [Theileria annulata]
MLYKEWIVEDIKWCLENGILRNTSNTLAGISEVKTHSKSEIKLTFSKLLEQLFESKIFNEDVKNNVEINVPIEILKAEAQKESTISKSLENVTKQLRNLIKSFQVRTFTEINFFYSFICDLMEIRNFNENNFKNVLNSTFDKLLTKKEFFMIRIFVTLVIKILKLAVLNLENTKKVNLKINGRWMDSIIIDNELVKLLHNGSVSGIYSRMKQVAFENWGNLNNLDNIYHENSVLGNKLFTGFNTVKATLMCELRNLSIWRQIIFTRIINHLSNLILNEENGYFNLLELKLNTLWNLILESIVESEIVTLHYDNIILMKNLHKMKNRNFNVYRLMIILKYMDSCTENLDDLENTIIYLNKKCNGKLEYKTGMKMWRSMDLSISQVRISD